MTKEEVLQGALALNGEDKKYRVTVRDDKIIIEADYAANAVHTRTSMFRCTAHLNDNYTYVETHVDHDNGRVSGGKAVKKQWSYTLSFDKETRAVEVEKEVFDSEEIKLVLRDYLASCGYTRTNKGFFKKLFGK